LINNAIAKRATPDRGPLIRKEYPASEAEEVKLFCKKEKDFLRLTVDSEVLVASDLQGAARWEDKKSKVFYYRDIRPNFVKNLVKLRRVAKGDLDYVSNLDARMELDAKRVEAQKNRDVKVWPVAWPREWK